MESIARVTGRVSVERLVSGGAAGDASTSSSGSAPAFPSPARWAPASPARTARRSSPPPHWRAADPICGQALDLFVSLYGAEAGTWR